MSRDRSYLSLDGVANGELPATAVTGFGFQYHKQRPVALAKHVRSLGLRQSPPTPVSTPSHPRIFALPHSAYSKDCSTILSNCIWLSLLV